MREGNLPYKDFFKDIFSSMKMSGKRSILSGAVTIWGVFIFVVIVGTSNGIDRGNRSNYDYLLHYSIISIYPGEVSMPVNGLVKGRRIVLKRSDADEIKNRFSDRSQSIYPRKFFNVTCSSGSGSSNLQLADFRDGLDERYLSFPSGGPFSESELLSDRKLCLLPEYVCAQLFDDSGDAVGKTVLLDGKPFIVKGVYTPIHNLRIRNVFVPFETAMSMRGGDDEISAIDVKLYSADPVSIKYALKDDIRTFLCSKKGVDINDLDAVRMEDQIDFVGSQEKFIGSIRIFTTILGLLSLMMGIIGVSSIIHLSVKERTKEIAIRLACGSSESSIFMLVLGESVMTMLVFGAVGIILASVLLRVATLFTERLNEGVIWVMIGDMSVTFSLVLISALLIVICGLIAGFAPARRAVSIKINDALSGD